MKNFSMLFTMSYLIISIQVPAQIKVSANGNVGISTTVPAYKLDINSIEARFYYSDRNALHINHSGLDPRITSTDRIVFYKSDGSGFANIQCQISTQLADRNLEENITSLENKGIATVEKLNGVSFSLKNDKTGRIQSGLFAQDVEAVIPEAVFSDDSTKIKSLAYSAIIPYLVEAIKEQQSQIKDLKDLVVSLNENLVAKGLVLNSVASEYVQNPNIEKARLDQNIPNPFKMQTSIDCFIPETANSAFLYNYSMNGTPLQKLKINGTGNQSVILNGINFVPGIYLYSLVIDGKEVGTRKMVVEK